MRNSLFKTVLLSLLCAAVTGCGKGGDGGQTLQSGLETSELRYMGYPGRVVLPELAAELGYLAPMQLNYVGVGTGGPQGIQTVLSDDVDISSQAFNGAIIKFIAAGAPVKAVISAYGTVEDPVAGYYVREDSGIHGPKDLLGKKVAVNILGAQMEFMLKEYLYRAGLSPEDIKQVTLVTAPPGSSEQLLRQKQVDVALLDGDAVARGGVRLLYNEYALYGEFTAGSYVMSDKFIREKPKAAAHIVAAIGKAIEWSRAHSLEENIALQKKIIQSRNRNEDSENAKYWRGWGVAGTGGLIADGEFQTWIDWLVRNGDLPADRFKPKDFYTNALNPYQGNNYASGVD